ncbi:rod shape-determining protein MreD [Paenibacillus aurantiacus]|uniref:Rod shape-determining protein MreD n=1 Tax=Paenibacillus aurantiacus TaxID=1936118 RepID=A0ABV5KT12_9BACL
MSMTRIVIVMLLFFYAEGTIFYWLLPDAWTSRLVPHFALAFALFAALYKNRYAALFLGFGFGLLQDIVFYNNILGVHAFAGAAVGYLTGLLMERKRSTLLMALVIIGLATYVYDTTVFFIYQVFRLNHMAYDWALINHILPSVFLQFGFALLMYIPARRWFEWNGAKKSEEEEE